MFLEDYLISLGYNSPTDFLVQDLNEYIGQIDNEDIQETAIYSLCKERVHLENLKSFKIIKLGGKAPLWRFSK